MTTSQTTRLETFVIGNNTTEHLRRCIAVERSSAFRSYTGRGVTVREITSGSHPALCLRCRMSVRFDLMLSLLHWYSEVHGAGDDYISVAYADSEEGV
jgi:hypothetical protein